MTIRDAARALPAYGGTSAASSKPIMVIVKARVILAIILRWQSVAGQYLLLTRSR
jgi:hypothetical protein